MHLFKNIKVDKELAERNETRRILAIKNLGQGWLLHPKNAVKRITQANFRPNANLI